MITKKEGVDDSWVLQYRYRDDNEWFLHGITHAYDCGKSLSTILFMMQRNEGIINPYRAAELYAFQLFNTITNEVIPWEALGA